MTKTHLTGTWDYMYPGEVRDALLNNFAFERCQCNICPFSLDFFAYENGRKSGVTMGLATVGGVCMDKYNCVIAELGTTNVFGKPYPSAGFTSVYVLAHEIGHK